MATVVSKDDLPIWNSLIYQRCSTCMYSRSYNCLACILTPYQTMRGRRGGGAGILSHQECRHVGRLNQALTHMQVPQQHPLETTTWLSVGVQSSMWYPCTWASSFVFQPLHFPNEVDALLSCRGGSSFVSNMYFPTFDCSVFWIGANTDQQQH